MDSNSDRSADKWNDSAIIDEVKVIRSKATLLLLFILLLPVLVLCGCTRQKAKEEKVTIRFGVLPVLQALDLFVASEEGYFEKAGVDVELIPFNTSTESTIALSTGKIDGYFADLFTPAVIRGNGVDCRIVATNYNTQQNRRMFAVLGKKGGGYSLPGDLKGVPVAISSNTVIDYITEYLLKRGGLAASDLATFESKNIGMRMQMLMSGQLEAATLPEPLVSAAIAGGATLIADDRGVETSQTVFVFTESVIKKHPSEIKKFLTAVGKAHELINTHPDSIRSVMVEHIRLPEPMKNNYPVPVFPELQVPGESTVNEVAFWLVGKGVLSDPLVYSQFIDGDFIK